VASPDSSPDSGLCRRGFVLLGVGTLLAGCSAGAHPVATPTSRSSSAAPPSAAPSSPAVHSSSPTPSPLPQVAVWRPSPNDVDPRVKSVAVAAVLRMVAGRRTAVEVVDAQYGGILTASASVLVVTRSWTRGRDGVVRPGGATYDVRLVRNGSWRVTEVHPSHPGPPARWLGAAARRVLRHHRIDLPPAARADVASGQVHDSVLEAMLTLARDVAVGVSVVRSGHPTHVFGTSRLSDHPQGRAFDTWRIDGHAVVDARTPRRVVVGYMEALAGLGSSNVGGPYLLGGAPQWFSDATHHDHVHAGFAG